MFYEKDHIDPRWVEGRDYQLVCGLDVPLNFIERERGENISKSNRFLPYRIIEGDIGSVPRGKGTGPCSSIPIQENGFLRSSSENGTDRRLTERSDVINPM